MLSMRLIFQEIGDFETRSGEIPPDICNASGYLRKSISGQIEAKSLERAHMCKYMIIAEFNIKGLKAARKIKFPYAAKKEV